MPVYDYSYKIWEGERLGPLFRWLAIPKFAYMELMKYRIFTASMTCAAIMFLGWAGYMYVFVNEELLKLLPRELLSLAPKVGPSFFEAAIYCQFPMCFILAFVMGANLISRDLKHNAVVLYASKPISRWEYFLGKFSVLFFIFMGLLGVLPLCLFILQSAIASSHSEWHFHFWSKYAQIGPEILLYGFMAATTLSLLIMACSCMTENGRYAGITFVIFIVGAEVVSGLLSDYVNSTQFLALAPFNCGLVLGDYIFHIGEMAHKPISQPAAWAGIIGYWIISAYIINNRVARRARYGR